MRVSSVYLYPYQDTLPTEPEWWTGWLDQWPFGLIRQVYERLWNFVSRPISTIATAVNNLLQDRFRAAYSWMRGIFLPLLPGDAQYAYPEAAGWMSLTDLLCMSFRLPPHALLEGLKGVPGTVGTIVGLLLGNLQTTLSSWLKPWEQLPYQLLYNYLVASGALGDDARLRFPAPDPNWGWGVSFLHLFRLSGYSTAYQVWQARDWLQARIADLGTTFSPLINAVTDTLKPIVDGITSTVATTLARIPIDLGTILANIKTAVLTDLPNTLGGLAQAVANKVGPLITTAIAGLGDLPTLVKNLIKPLLDTIGTSLGSFATTATATLSNVTFALGGITNAVITAIPGIIGGIIPAIIGALTSAQAALSVLITSLVTTLAASLASVQTALSATIASVRTSLGATLTNLDAYLKGRLSDIKAALDTLPSNLPDLVLGALRDTLSNITSGITNLPANVWSFIKPSLDTIGSGITGLPNAVWTFIKPTLDSIGSGIGGIPDQLTILGADVKTTLLKPIIGGQQVVSDFLKAIGDALGNIGPYLERWDTFQRQLPTSMFDPRWLNILSSPLGGLASTIDAAPMPPSLGDLVSGAPPGISSILRVMNSVLNYGGRWLDAGVKGLVDHLTGLGYMSPDRAQSSLVSVQAITREMALGLGAFALVGESFSIWKEFGLGQISAILWDMTNFKLITGAAMGVLAAVALERPLRYYYNDLFRPVLPEARDLVDQFISRLLTREDFDKYMGYHGLPPDAIARLADDSWQGIRLTEIMRIGEADVVLPPLPETVAPYLANAGLTPPDPADYWIAYKLGRRGYSDFDVKVLTMAIRASRVRRHRETYVAQVRRLYATGYLSVGQARQMLGDAWDILDPREMHLAIMDLDRLYQSNQDQRSMILAAMTHGILTPAEAQDALVDLGLDPQRAAVHVYSNRLGLLPRLREELPELSLDSPAWESAGA